MGSRILSRSFHVEPWGKSKNENEDEDEAGTNVNTSMDSAMDVDEPVERHDTGNGEPEPEEGSDDEDEEIEDPADVTMVPMADMLNARFESENVGLTFVSPKLTALCLVFCILIIPTRRNYFMKKRYSKWSQQKRFRQANRS